MNPNQYKWPQTLIAIIAVLLFCISAISTPVQVNASDDLVSIKKVVLTVGKSTVIENPVMIKKIAIAKTDCADIKLISPRQLYLIGKEPGATNATLWDVNDKMNAILDIEVLPDVSRLKAKIYEMMPDEKDIRVTTSHDSLVLAGTVSNTANLSQVLALAQPYAPGCKDGKGKIINLLEVGGVHQVMLEVRVSEMSRTLMRRLGVNFNYISDGGNTWGISTLNNLVTPAGWPAGSFTVADSINAVFQFLGANATWTTFIDALKENGLTKVLAEPTLITTSGRPASFLAGGEYPIPVPDEDGITIQYKTFGVALAFTPTVLSNKKINIEVKPEVSELDTSNAVAISGYIVPAITTRRVSTVVELADGQSFAIAGLLKEDIREVVSKFPVLGDIPVLGALFRSTSFRKNETELVIIVTPHLVKPVDMAKQTLPTDQYVEPDDFEFYLLGSLEGRGGQTAQTSSTSKSVLPPRSAKGGLEGDFGHISPK